MACNIDEVSTLMSNISITSTGCNIDEVLQKIEEIDSENQYCNGEDIYNKFVISLHNRNEIASCAYYIIFSLGARKIINNKEEYGRFRNACLLKIKNVFPNNSIFNFPNDEN